MTRPINTKAKGKRPTDKLPTPKGQLANLKAASTMWPIHKQPIDKKAMHKRPTQNGQCKNKANGHWHCWNADLGQAAWSQDRQVVYPIKIRISKKTPRYLWNKKLFLYCLVLFSGVTEYFQISRQRLPLRAGSSFTHHMLVLDGCEPGWAWPEEHQCDHVTSLNNTRALAPFSAPIHNTIRRLASTTANTRRVQQGYGPEKRTNDLHKNNYGRKPIE